MKKTRKYRLSVEDESRLRNVASVSMRLWQWIAAGVIFFSICLFMAGMLIYLTPLRGILPGYMKQGERAATEVGILRLDSLTEAYRRNEAYLNNVMTVLNTDRTPAETSSEPPATNMLAADSLTEASDMERKFVAEVREREKYNISVVAPLAADAMMFVPVSEQSVISSSTRGSHRAHVILARGEAPASIADGRVVGIFASPGQSGYTMMIQHAKGFLSSYSRLGMPLAGIGDEVTGGQAIALPADGSGISGSDIYLCMWHNGTPLIPYEYVGGSWQREEERVP